MPSRGRQYTFVIEWNIPTCDICPNYRPDNCELSFVQRLKTCAKYDVFPYFNTCRVIEKSGNIVSDWVSTQVTEKQDKMVSDWVATQMVM
jgi:hypothetical protein